MGSKILDSGFQISGSHWILLESRILDSLLPLDPIGILDSGFWIPILRFQLIATAILTSSLLTIPTALIGSHWDPRFWVPSIHGFQDSWIPNAPAIGFYWSSIIGSLSPIGSTATNFRDPTLDTGFWILDSSIPGFLKPWIPIAPVIGFYWSSLLGPYSPIGPHDHFSGSHCTRPEGSGSS